jgi:uncharacterized protein
MRYLIAVLFAGASLNTLSAQDVTGDWFGLLKIQSMQINVVFHIKHDGNGLAGTMDSPDQGAKGLPMSAVQFGDSLLHVEMKNLNVVYDGKWLGDRIEGLFKQNGMAIPLVFSREAAKMPVLTRPQEPRKPSPYYSEDVKFENSNSGISLAGTLTLPQKTGKFPVVILISGSGQHNRDGEMLGHKPFLVLADHLTKKGIAVLRYDDRGVGKSTGNFASAITTDFASDVSAAISYLLTRPEIDAKKIGLIGHSEGGLVAPMVAVERKEVGFIVLLAGPALPGEEILAKQSWLIGKANGLSDSLLANGEVVNRKIYAALKKQGSDDDIKLEVTSVIEDAVTALPGAQQPPIDKRALFVSQKVSTVVTPWFRFFVSYDPAPTLSKLKCPVLALYGENDLQVPPKENAASIKTMLAKGKNKNFLVKELLGLNHLFQESKTGSPGEYGKIEQTFSPVAMTEISNWILLQTSK